MNALFGLSMTYIAIGCVAITAAILGFVALIAVRNPVMFKMGLRNIPRRPAQTGLIVIGLMLSTLIMSAAFGTGDTLTSSVTSEVYKLAGQADEIVGWDTEKQPAPQEQQVIPISEIDRWQQELANDADVEALAPFLQEQVPVQNQRTRLNESSASVVAFRPHDLQTFGGVRDLSGNDVQVGPGEIAINKKLAEQIDAVSGDKITIFYEGQPFELTVKAVVANTVLAGAFNSAAPQGGLVDFASMAQVTNKADVADGVMVSNVGGVKEGLKLTDKATEKLDSLIGDQPYKVNKIKQDNIEFAELFGNAFTTIFVVFGLFSIAAGVLLIFLIFVMLAAERKPEMGMARAVGAKRRQLVESFLAEGMGYDLGAAVVGLVAGLGVTIAMVQIIKSAAGDTLGLDLQVTFTLRSMVVAFCIGVIATFIVIFVSSWRASRLNITAAIRDLPESKPLNPEAGTLRGYIRAGLNGIIAFGVPLGFAAFLMGPIGMLWGAPLLIVGLIAPWFYLLRGQNVALPREHRTDQASPRWPWILGLALPFVGWFLILPFYFIALLLVRIVRDRKPSNMPLWLAVLGIVVPPLGFVVALLQRSTVRISWSTAAAFAFGLAGISLSYGGLNTDSQFFFYLGFSLLFLFAAVTCRHFGLNERLTFTTTGALLLVLWYLPSKVMEPITGELNGDIEMFFLSGMVMVTAAVFVVVYNADIILPVIASLGSRFGRILPAIKTGIAYPLTARFRTGMTMVMIGLIMFSLVMMATMNTNFANVYLNDQTRGGFDEVLVVNGNNLIDNLDQSLQQAGVDTTPIIERGEVRIAYPFEAEVENRDKKEVDGEVPEYSRYAVIGADRGFIESNAIEMKHIANGYGSTEEVWQALANDPKLAVLPASVSAPADPFSGPVGEMLKLNEIPDHFEPFTLRMRDPGTGNTTTVTVIGVMKESADVFFALGSGLPGSGGLVTGASTVSETFPAARGQVFYLSVADGTDKVEYAKSIESGLVQVSADSLQRLLDEQQSIQNGFLMVFQGFMGLGLIVGIAALAVVASRAVVERRQQIGMLRAIGYQRGMVALSFLFESGFIALSGIMLGLVLGLSLSWALFISGDFGDESKGMPFTVPWLNIAIICAVAFIASMVMTYLPSRQASKVPVAEALRYE